MESGERWWAAEMALRGFGLLLLAGCAGAASWLARSLGPASHEADLADFIAAALAVLCAWFGLAFLAEGPALFKLIALPGRHWIS